MEFSEKLKMLRAQAGFTQNELADKLVISRQAISNYEQGRGYPSMDILVEISRLFNTGLDELLSTGIRKKYLKYAIAAVGLLFLGNIVNIISLYFVRANESNLLLNMVILIGIYVIPFMYIFVYLLFQYKPPQRINKIYGYRTKASMKNQLTWDYSQAYFSLIFAKIATVLFSLNIAFGILMALLNQSTILIAGCILFGAHALSLLVPIFFVEKKLKRFFCK